MKIKFYLADSEAANCILTEEKRIAEFNVFSERFPRILLKRFYADKSYSGLHEMLKYYMAGEFTVEEYLNHIMEYGFYSPYSKNFNIKIEKWFEGELRWTN